MREERATVAEPDFDPGETEREEHPGSFDPGTETGYLRRGARSHELPVEIGAAPFDPGSEHYDERRARKASRREQRAERKRRKRERELARERERRDQEQRERADREREARLRAEREQREMAERERRERRRRERAEREQRLRAERESRERRERAEREMRARAKREERERAEREAAEPSRVERERARREVKARRRRAAEAKAESRRREEAEQARSERRRRAEPREARRRAAVTERAAAKDTPWKHAAGKQSAASGLRRARELPPARTRRITEPKTHPHLAGGPATVTTAPVPRRKQRHPDIGRAAGSLRRPTAKAVLALAAIVGLAVATGAALGLPAPELSGSDTSPASAAPADPLAISPGTPIGLTEGPYHPVVSPTGYGEAAARFGAPRGGRKHEGQDIFGKPGTPLVAVRDGVVLDGAGGRSFYSGGGGNTFVMYSPLDDRSYVYLHLLKPAVLKKGDRVKAGQLVGQLGCTGSCDGPHLHFEVREGRAVFGPQRKAFNPLPLLRQWPQRPIG